MRRVGVIPACHRGRSAALGPSPGVQPPMCRATEPRPGGRAHREADPLRGYPAVPEADGVATNTGDRSPAPAERVRRGPPPGAWTHDFIATGTCCPIRGKRL